MTDNLTVLKIKKTPNPPGNERTVIAQPEHDKTVIYRPLKENQEVVQIASVNSNIRKKQKQNIRNKKLTVSIGSVINNRFVLVEVLGVGGMGKVYKTIDLRKKEAHDKNPYIAVKVLNDEFRNHPESLIALQREARKSQQLSHPNIVNVHDFDRDGDVVYMTMELLQGQPLDELIAEQYPQGMTEEEGTLIINAIANALLYAHQHGIIHSDLKPSNIFITDANVAKIFDFGIARACQISHELVQDNNKDKTLFDPTALGALTPTYASLEMLEGEAPEPHDDIYSIACVFYELLTGKHPYKRLPADKAKQKLLKLKKIGCLDKSKLKTKSQAIQKALEFEGKNRFENMEMFINAYNYKKKSKLPILISSFIIMIVFTTIFFPEIQEQYYFYQQTKFIEQVNSLKSDVVGDERSRIQHHISTLDHQTRLYVLEQIKTQWLILVEQSIITLKSPFLNNAFSMNDETSKDNKYNETYELLKVSQMYYSDSAQVARLAESFEKYKFLEINYLNSQFNELLEILQFSQLSSTSVEHKQILELVNQVKNIENNHPLVKDQRLLLIYQDHIERLLSDHEFNEANKLLAKAYSIFPEDIILQNLIDKSKSLENSQDNGNIYLTGDPEELNTGIQVSLQNISELKENLSELINEHKLSQDWDNNVTIIFTQLHDKLGNRSLWLNEKKQTLAFLYLKKSVSMRDKQRLVEARRLLDKSKDYTRGIFGMDDEEAILVALENIVQVKQKARQRLAKIKGLKTSLSSQLKAQDMISAIRTYAVLKRILGRNDPYIAREAKLTIAQAYYNRARQMFFNKRYQQTIEVVINGLKFERHHSGLKSLRTKAEKQKKILENSRRIAKEYLNKRLLQKNNVPVIDRDKIKPNY